jgi:hypothetical protein
MIWSSTLAGTCTLRACTTQGQEKWWLGWDTTCRLEKIHLGLNSGTPIALCRSWTEAWESLGNESIHWIMLETRYNVDDVNYRFCKPRVARSKSCNTSREVRLWWCTAREKERVATESLSEVTSKALTHVWRCASFFQDQRGWPWLCRLVFCIFRLCISYLKLERARLHAVKCRES